MVAGSEAQAGIEDNDRLAWLWLPPAPARKNQQPRTDLERMKMSLPRLGPVFAPDWRHGHSARPEFQPALAYQRQAAPHFPPVRGGDDGNKNREQRRALVDCRVDGRG